MTDNFYEAPIFDTQMENIEIKPFDPEKPDAGILRGINPVEHSRLAEYGDDLVRNPKETSDVTMRDKRGELSGDEALGG